jgi:parallel beta-helix repeat protein
MKNLLTSKYVRILGISLIMVLAIALFAGIASADQPNYYPDVDEDTYGDENAEPVHSNPHGDLVENNLDCDDTDGNINPDTVWYLDGDADGYSEGTSAGPQCSRPTNYYYAGELTATSGDCDDSEGTVYPGATEVADDSIDQNCNGYDLVTYYQDYDTDTYGNTSVSQQVDGEQPAGYVTNDDDCDDTDIDVNPDADEIVGDGIDNNCDGTNPSTIQAAINAATSGDTIKVIAGTYYENVDFIGKALTVQSISGKASTTINASASGSVVSFKSYEGADSILDGFTITNGAGTNDGGNYYGGGIYIKNSSPSIKNCTITGNSVANSGGGIYSKIFNPYEASPDIYNCTINYNTAGEAGGGISFGGGGSGTSTPSISYSTISYNTATTSYGGGIFSVHNETTIDHCLIDNNTSGYRGAGYYFSGISRTSTCSDTTISNNTAESAGGGVACSDGSCTLSFTDCTFSGNEVTNGHGGGIYVTATITFSGSNTISGNSASHAGGGIYIASNSTISGCTIEDNTATDGGGIYGGCTTVSDCTIRGNSADYGGGIYSYVISYITNCFISDNDTVYKGAGGFHHNADTEYTNCTITDNTASGYSGGGIHIEWYSDVVLTNCTISNNSANDAGGGLFLLSSSTADILNSIIWGNTADAPAEDAFISEGSSMDINYSDFDPNKFYDMGTLTGSNNINEDPVFVDDDNVDISLRDYHLTSSSGDVVDGGTATGAPSDDIDGDTRDSYPDMGSDEYIAP